MVKVEVSNGRVDEYPNALAWRVESDGELHVKRTLNKPGEAIATYAEGSWVRAGTFETE